MGGCPGLWGNNGGVGRGLFWHNPYSKEQCYLLEALTGKYLHHPFAQVNSIRPLLTIVIMIITKLKKMSKSIQCVVWGGWILGTKDLQRLYSEILSDVYNGMLLLESFASCLIGCWSVTWLLPCNISITAGALVMFLKDSRKQIFEISLENGGSRTQTTPVQDCVNYLPKKKENVWSIYWTRDLTTMTYNKLLFFTSCSHLKTLILFFFALNRAQGCTL